MSDGDFQFVENLAPQNESFVKVKKQRERILYCPYEKTQYVLVRHVDGVLVCVKTGNRVNLDSQSVQPQKSATNQGNPKDSTSGKA